ncbi:shikimate dehydrogenase, partial [Candidatus Margulisiibacteriota bacterium]
MNINGKTKIIGIIGNPVEHSASPIMHNTILQQLGLNYVYIPLPTKRTEVHQALTAIKTFNFSGINVTIPFKEQVIPFLDQLDPLANKIGAVNTIINKAGKLIGYNTDGTGFVYALTKDYKYDLTNKSVAILGSGGSAKSISFALLEQKIKKLIVINRTLKNAQVLADSLRAESQVPIETKDFKVQDVTQALSQADLIINTTPLGMTPEIHLQPLDNYSWIKKSHLCCDTIYNPL